MSIRAVVLLTALVLLTWQAGMAQEDSLSQRLAHTEDEVEGMKESLQTLLNDVTGLKKLKTTGYMQVRFDYADSSKSGMNNELKNSSISAFGNNFYVRRARLKVAYEPAPLTSKYVFYFNFGRSGFPTILEAYAQLYKKFKSDGTATLDITMGQFNVPFGYEIEYSSSKREFGERSQAEQALFPGERDRGVNANLEFYGKESFVKFNVAMLQGRGIGTGATDWQDFTKTKDFVGRARFNWKNYYIGASYYAGDVYVEPVAATTTWFDKDGDHAVDSTEVTNTSAKASKLFDKIRRGVDAQAYFNFFPVGATALKGEFYQGFGVGNNDSRFLGYYIWLSQQLGTKFSFAYRFDNWDPNARESVKGDRVGLHTAIVNYYWDSNLKLSLEYVMPKDELDPNNAKDKDRHDNIIRTQAMFIF